MSEIRWGIIGCGDVTEVKSGPGFQKVENSSLVAVMRRNGELAKDYAQRHQVPHWYDDAGELINDPEVDAVYIATPPAFHKEYTIMAAQKGKPVYVEKPMARSYQECKEMIVACDSEKVPLFVAYYRRALPRFLKIKELLEAGTIGEVRFVSVKLYQRPTTDEKNAKALPWRVVPEIAGGGNFLDLASHTLDFLDFFLGPITGVQGKAGNQAGLYEAEDIVTANFTFASGIQGIGVWSFAAFEDYDLNEIVGSKGKIVFSSFETEPILLFTEQGSEEFPISNPRHVQLPLIQTVVNDLLDQGVCPSTGESAARTNQVMDQIMQSYRQSNGISFK